MEREKVLQKVRITADESARYEAAWVAWAKRGADGRPVRAGRGQPNSFASWVRAALDAFSGKG